MSPVFSGWTVAEALGAFVERSHAEHIPTGKQMQTWVLDGDDSLGTREALHSQSSPERPLIALRRVYLRGVVRVPSVRVAGMSAHGKDAPVGESDQRGIPPAPARAAVCPIRWAGLMHLADRHPAGRVNVEDPRVSCSGPMMVMKASRNGVMLCPSRYEQASISQEGGTCQVR